MAEGKVNRNNHPILVKARRESYWAGRKEGYNDGYATGYGYKGEMIHDYYKTILHALERKVEVLTTTLREENLAYSQGYREGYRDAKQDIQNEVDEIKRCIKSLEEKEADA